MSRHRSAGRRAVGVLALLPLAACDRGVGPLGDDAFPRVVRHTPAEYAEAPRLVVRRATPLCGDVPHPCRYRDVAGAAIGPSGEALIAAPGRGVDYYAVPGAPPRQLLAGGAGGVGAARDRDVESVRYDGAGRYVAVDLGRLAVYAIDTTGAVRDSAPLTPRLHVAGVRAWRGGAAVLRIPPGDTVGAPVVAHADVVRFGGAERVGAAVVPVAAREARGSDLVPMPPFFRPASVWDVDRDGGVIVGDGATDRLDRYDAEGRAAWRLTLAVPGRPVTEADRSRESARVLAMFSPGGWQRRTRPIVEQAAARTAAVHPRITALVAATDGTLWARESPDAADSVRWNVLAADGRWVGWTRLPAGLRVHDAMGGTVLATERTADGWLVPRRLELSSGT